jgi:hypothetical protein
MLVQPPHALSLYLSKRLVGFFLNLGLDVIVTAHDFTVRLFL